MLSGMNTKPKKRPSDVVSNAVHIMKVLTGEVEDTPTPEKNAAAVELGRKGGSARATALTKEQRSAIAKRAAKSRWAKKDT